jgi:hypothetical protein
MASVLIYFLGLTIRFQWLLFDNRLQILLGGTAILMILTGLFSIKTFYQTKDNLLTFCLLLFLIGVGIRFVGFFDPFRFLIYMGPSGIHLLAELFSVAAVLILMRYFVLRRAAQTPLNRIWYPFIFVILIWMVGLLFKIQSWPYATEILTIGVLSFLVGIIIMLILKLKKDKPALNIINAWLVLMAIMFAFGFVFKMQSWYSGPELIVLPFLGGIIGFILKLIQKQKLQKQAEETIE